jgi:hypothetical protein
MPGRSWLRFEQERIPAGQTVAHRPRNYCITNDYTKAVTANHRDSFPDRIRRRGPNADTTAAPRDLTLAREHGTQEPMVHVELSKPPQSAVQTITTHFARRLGGNARCLLPEFVNSKAAPAGAGRYRLVPSFTAGRLRPECQAARSGWAFACSYSGSGARSMPPGQTIVPASRSTVTSAK